MFHLFQERTHPVPVYHPTPGESRLASQLTEEEQVRIAQRIGLIHHLPRGIFDPGSDPSDKKVKECVITGAAVSKIVFYTTKVFTAVDLTYRLEDEQMHSPTSLLS